MKIRLTKDLCYLAGTQACWKGEASSIGICTSNAELQQRFISLLIGLGVKPEKIKVSKSCTICYNSRLAKRLAKIRQRSLKIFSRISDKSLSYIAGIVDACAKQTKQGISIRLDRQSTLLLELLGFHTRDGYVLNLGDFIMLIKPYSLFLSSIRTPGNERDPR